MLRREVVVECSCVKVNKCPLRVKLGGGGRNAMFKEKKVEVMHLGSASQA